jgi:hypothetical protein
MRNAQPKERPEMVTPVAKEEEPAKAPKLKPTPVAPPPPPDEELPQLPETD